MRSSTRSILGLESTRIVRSSQTCRELCRGLAIRQMPSYKLKRIIGFVPIAVCATFFLASYGQVTAV
ncbi:MAG: hypothetical protein HYY68_08910 [Thaumarchaeota archaeon]|nr:hypothetical protein [Nitrososphaerota archaeon]